MGAPGGRAATAAAPPEEDSEEAMPEAKAEAPVAEGAVDSVYGVCGRVGCVSVVCTMSNTSTLPRSRSCHSSCSRCEMRRTLRNVGRPS